MSGQNESKPLTVNEQLAEFEQIMNEHETKIDLMFPKCKPVEIETALNITEEDLKIMNAEECGIKAHTLSKYIMHLQKDINRNNLRTNWAKDKLNKLLGAKGDQYGDKYTKYEAKLGMLCADNTYAAGLNNILLHAESRIISLNNITMHISLICNTLIGLQNSKRRQQYDSN